MHGETGAARSSPEQLAAHLGLNPVEDVSVIMETLARYRAHACLEALVAEGVPHSQLSVRATGMGAAPRVDFIPLTAAGPAMTMAGGWTGKSVSAPPGPASRSNAAEFLQSFGAASSGAKAGSGQSAAGTCLDQLGLPSNAAAAQPPSTVVGGSHAHLGSSVGGASSCDAFLSSLGTAEAPPGTPKTTLDFLPPPKTASSPSRAADHFLSFGL